MADTVVTEEACLYVPDAATENWGTLLNDNFTQLDMGMCLKFTAGETIAKYSTVYLKSDGEIWKTDVDTIATMPAIGICPNAITSGVDGLVLVRGWLDYDDTALGGALAASVNSLIYLSGTAGRITVTRPVNGQIIGYAKTATAAHITRIIFNFLPYQDRVIQQQQVAVEDLAAEVDITNRPIFVSPTGLEFVTIGILTLGAPAGVNDANTSVITLKDDAGNTIVAKTYNTGTQPPSSDYADLGALSATHKVLTAGEHVTLSVANGATADLPAFLIILEYKLGY